MSIGASLWPEASAFGSRLLQTNPESASTIVSRRHPQSSRESLEFGGCTCQTPAHVTTEPVEPFGAIPTIRMSRGVDPPDSYASWID